MAIMLAVILFSFTLYDNDFFGKNVISNKNENNNSHIILQTSYAVEEDYDDDEKDQTINDDYDKKSKSLFNIAAVGDWDCTGETEDTVDNIVNQDPEIVLALGDLSYNGKAKCWLELIEPIADKTKIAIGNHEIDSDDLTEDYMNFFGLTEQYYSFNYKNVHFLALSTETDYDDESEQYQFAIKDLQKYSNDPLYDWIIVFFHRYIYGSASLEEDTDFRETYHPLFDKYKVDLALQGHLHAYERTYPITFNNEDDDEPIVQDSNPTNIYRNPKGPIFLTVGTGGAHDMVLSSLQDYTAEGIDSTFGILDLTLENDQKTLTGKYIENGKKKEIMDEFKIIKE